MTSVSFANLSVTYGRKELLDYPELLLRAIFVDTNVRRTRGSTYHFIDQGMLRLRDQDPLSLVIFGRVVRETVLKREQVMVDGEVRRAPATLDTAPSAFFALFLADHRVAVVPDTAYAPGPIEFGATLRYFLKNEYDAFFRTYYEAHKAENSKFTLAKAREIHPEPMVNIVPLVSHEDLAAFMSRFSKLNSIAIYLIRKNQDMDGAEMFGDLFEASVDIDAETAQYRASGGSDGLNIRNAERMLASAAVSGYEDIRLRGRDRFGSNLIGSNDDFKLTHPLEEGLADQQKIMEASRIYEDYKARNVIRVDPRDAAVTGGKLAELERLHAAE